MDELYNVLVILFRNILPKSLINGNVSYDKIPLQMLLKICFAYEKHSDESEILKRLQYLNDQVNFELHERGVDIDESECFNVFNLVDIFTEKLLEEKQGEVVCKFKYLQEWRKVTNKIDNTLFLAAKYAKIDYENGKIRSSFIWPDIIGHDNVQLNRILSEGISDNHFHLLGSFYAFPFTWLTLMNHVNQNEFTQKLADLDNNKRNPRIRLSYDYEEQRYEIQHLQAALIRLYLFSELTERYIEIGHYFISLEKVILHIVKDSVDINEFIKKYARAILNNESSDVINILRQENPQYFWLLEKIFNDDLITGNTCKINELVEQENPVLYLIQLSEKVGNISLSECSWIFSDRQNEYQQEWKRQTRQNVWRMLKSPEKLMDFRSDLQLILNGFIDQINEANYDYAVSGASAWYDTDETQSFMIGERWLEYTMLREKYERTGRLTEEHYNLFYLYLIIKESFRMELQQSNDKTGFINFQYYQKRKGMFSLYYTCGELARAAIAATVRKQNIKSLEIRIHFGNDCAENAKIINYYDKELSRGMLKNYKDNFYYVMGFSKRMDSVRKNSDEYGNIFYRHYELRTGIYLQANALIQFRKKNPELAQRIRGIDAFSNEDGCRPEVFATAYRVLKKHSSYRGLSIKPEIPQLRETYHVGEVFSDILDGLRAIDEAVLFLNLDCGDRLGHATVLGMDVENWYRDNNYKISMRRQDYLDNIVWLYHKLLQYRIPDTDTLMQYIETEFEQFFTLIYRKFMGEKYIESVARSACEYDSRYDLKYQYREQNSGFFDQAEHHVYDFEYGNVNKNDGAILDFNIRNYYYSWTLRGDHPGLYRDGFCQYHYNIKSIWDEYSINREFPQNQRIRYSLSAAVLNHFYHFNESVKESGRKTETFKIPANMVKAISLVQKAMQFELAHKEIAIETNPSSNMMINRIESYDQHPIFQLFNIGLVHDAEKLDNCPQMNVSINTDDQGIFATCLSNEYALVASALSKVKDTNGNHVYKKAEIYEWIRKVQKMGNNQSFLEQ